MLIRKTELTERVKRVKGEPSDKVTFERNVNEVRKPDMEIPGGREGEVEETERTKAPRHA